MMQYKGYVGKVEFDADAAILHGEVVGIRDVVTFTGKSVAEVERAFRESVDDYLAFCKKRGEEPDKPHSGKFMLRIDSELHRQANMLASAEGESLNSWVAKHLKDAVAGKGASGRRLLSRTGSRKTVGRHRRRVRAGRRSGLMRRPRKI